MDELKNERVIDAMLEDKLKNLTADFAVFRVNYERDFKFYAATNLVWAAILYALLCLISFVSDEKIDVVLASVICVVSVAPAVATIGLLWHFNSGQAEALNDRRRVLERRLRSAPKRPSSQPSPAE
ncbi:hypothetical protein [Falsiroseomonas oryziterrae]|uniref:hypothetical protein n=1 Tax=Falsiroseomonas oryziterrae TaxID=2911368 RepID=UPI001F1E7C91|nr:hypothetical protein [Roseomonas sp. NPKOSM-4]